MRREHRTVYTAVVFHDSEYEAAVATKDLGYYLTRQSATRAINAARDTFWQTGQVCRGTLWAAVFGKLPERFESDLGWSWFVGTDGKAVR